MKNVVMAGAVRTAIGKFGGSLSATPVVELGATVIRESIRRSGIPVHEVDEVLMGCVLQAAAGQNVARQAAVLAGIPVEAPALTLNNVCGSGLKCINMAASLIAGGEADVIIAGGMENMSMAPYALMQARFGYRMNDGDLLDTLITDSLTDAFHHYHMGITAENIAEKYCITREMQDEFAANSQKKCEYARKFGRFRDEIVAVKIRRKQEEVFFAEDEYPRDGVTREGIAGLKPAFMENGTVTAANASGINDGAAAIVLMSEKKAEQYGVEPMAWFSGGASAGTEPALMGMGPVMSTKKLLKKTGTDISEIALIEANEAFAAQVLAVQRQLKWDNERVNVNGGAIALGHPVGASGCRIMVTLLHEMKKRNAKNGLATLCVGGGMGVSALVARK